MSPKQILKRDTFVCKWKVALATEEEAQGHLVMLKARSDLPRPDEMSTYRCMCCQNFHVGHTPKWRKSE